jgi:hypothetical protein
MNNKNLLWIMLILVLPLMSAQTYQINTELDLKIPFEVNGTIASANAQCNISINYPDGTYLVRNSSMTNLNNGDFNFTLSDSNLSKIGDYEWRAFCCDGTQCAAGYGGFEITPSGSDAISSGESMTLLLAVGSILVFSILFFIASFKVVSFPSKIIFMGFSLIFFVVVLLFSMVSFGQILGGYSALVESYSSFFWVALFMFLLVFIFLLLCLIKKSVELIKINKGLM